MSWVVLVVGSGLIVLWLAALVTAAAAPWYSWMTFVVAVILLVVGTARLTRTR